MENKHKQLMEEFDRSILAVEHFLAVTKLKDDFLKDLLGAAKRIKPKSLDVSLDVPVDISPKL